MFRLNATDPILFAANMEYCADHLQAPYQNRTNIVAAVNEHLAPRNNGTSNEQTIQQIFRRPREVEGQNQYICPRHDLEYKVHLYSQECFRTLLALQQAVCCTSSSPLMRAHASDRSISLPHSTSRSCNITMSACCNR